MMMDALFIGVFMCVSYQIIQFNDVQVKSLHNVKNLFISLILNTTPP